MYVPVRTARMHIEGLWSVSVSKPSKGRGATERSSSSSSSIARVCVSVHVCVTGGGEREGRHGGTPGRGSWSRGADPASLLHSRRTRTQGRGRIGSPAWSSWNWGHTGDLSA